MLRNIAKVLLLSACLSPLVTSASEDNSSSHSSDFEIQVSSDSETFGKKAPSLFDVSVAYSWADAIDVLKINEHKTTTTVVNAQSIDWTLTFNGKTSMSGSITDPINVPSGSGALTFANLAAGKYSLTLTGKWLVPEDLSNGSKQGSVSLGNAVIKAPAGSSGLPVTLVPEPESYAMLLAGLVLIGTVVRRKRQTGADAGG